MKNLYSKMHLDVDHVEGICNESIRNGCYYWNYSEIKNAINSIV